MKGPTDAADNPDPGSRHADAELRGAFQALRSAEHARAPAFAATLTAPSQRTVAGRRAGASAGRPPRRVLTLGGLAAAAVAAFLLLFPGDGAHGPPPGVAPVDLSRVAWTAPSDFLLATPGRPFLTAVPKLAAPPLTTTPDPDPSGRDPS